MLDRFVSLFIRNSDQIQDPKVRARYGTLTGVMGIVLNLCLFLAKFIAGFLTGSIAVTADAFNNLSDAGSSVVTLVGFKVAGKPADSQHPFGHGRVEYIAALAISVAILIVGLELFKSSFEKILHPEPVEFRLLSVAILAVAILVKLWMAYFNRRLGKKINSAAMRAVCMDSLTDSIATGAVLIGVLAGHFFGLQLDGWLGLLVALFIMYTGFSTIRDSLSPLLGQAPDPVFVREIEDVVLGHVPVVGVHDLIVHDYGPGRRIISLHAEVPATANLVEVHDVIDHIELELRSRFGCDATIHMDPIAIEDGETLALYQRVSELAAKIAPSVTIHDFRMVKGPTHTNLVFDVVVPHKFRISDQEVAERIQNGVKEINAAYFAVMQVERNFLGD